MLHIRLKLRMRSTMFRPNPVRRETPRVFLIIDQNNRGLPPKYLRSKYPTANKYVKWIKSEYLFSILAMVGFIFQANRVVQLFFRYDVVTSLVVKVPEEIKAPALSLCFNYDESLNMTAFKALTGNKDTKVSEAFIKEALTVTQIFNLTPSGEDLMRNRSCVVQKHNSYDHQSLECNQMFISKKYYKQHFICYQFELRRNHMYNFIHLVSRLTENGLTFELNLNSHLFTSIPLIEVTVHVSGIYPRTSQLFSETVYRDLNTESKNNNAYRVAYRAINRSLLKPPYATKCKDYIGTIESQRECFCHCLIDKAIETFKKVPFSCIIQWHQPYKHVSDKDIRNATFSKLLAKLESKCSRACSQPECNKTYFLTRVVNEGQMSGSGLKFAVLTPDQPSLDITVRKNLSNTEFILYLMSTFGVWFGLSVLSLASISHSLAVKIHCLLKPKGFQ